MKNERTFRAYFVYFVSMLCLVLLRAASALGWLEGISAKIGASVAFSLFAQCFSMGLVPLTLYFLLLTKRGSRLKTLKTDFRLNGIRARNFPEILVITFATIYVTTCVSAVWQGALGLIGFRSGGTSGGTGGGISFVILQIFIVAVLPAIFEELTNRGVLGAAEKNEKEYILFSALLFALMHQNVTQTGYTFVAGLVMAALCFYTNGIWASVFFHFMNNFISVLRAYTGALDFLNRFFGLALGGGIGSVLGALLFVMSVVLIVMSFCRIKSRMPKKLPRYTVTEFCSFKNFDDEKPNNREKIFLWLTVGMNSAATIFSLVWGLLR